MKKILGLDLGTNSIGWALINQAEEKTEILGLNSRIIPMSQEIIGEFDKGNSVSQTSARTTFRSTRRLHERNLLRRERLHRVLNCLDFLPSHYAQKIDKYGHFINDKEPKLAYFLNTENKYEFLFKRSYHEMLADFRQHQPQLFYTKPNGEESKIPYDWTIYYLRKKALTQKIEKEELAWLILHFNQKRGYYQLRGEDEETKGNKLEEFYNLKITDVQQTDNGKKAGETWYNVVLENGWIYRRSSKTPLFDWVGKYRDFIVTTELNDDGTVKTDKDGKEKRSFRAPKEDDWGLLKKKTESDIIGSNKTVGQFIYDTLLQIPDQKIKGKLVRTIERKFYKEELEKILDFQQLQHAELRDNGLYQQAIELLYNSNEDYKNSIANRDFKYLFVNDILFYQRPLKSKKSEISDCSLEFRPMKDEQGKLMKNELGMPILKPLKCIAKSHPLYQEFRLWQWLQNLHIYEREAMIADKLQNDVDVTETFLPNEEAVVSLFDFLNDRKEVDQKALLKFLIEPQKLKGKALTDAIARYRWNFIDDEKKTYPCNETRAQIMARLAKVENAPADFLNKENEIALWHILYSVKDIEEIKKALSTFAQKHGLHIDSFVENFRRYPLIKSEYGSFSEKAIKKLLPLMRMGKYWNANDIHPKTKERIERIITGEYDEKIQDRVREKAINLNDIESYTGLPLWLASYIVYDRHSEAGELTRWTTIQDLENYLKSFKQHSLRNPIVEQVLTETLRVVKDIWQQYGKGQPHFFDEIHIELGREMKNNAEDRKAITDSNLKNEATNLRIRAILAEFAKDAEIENVRPYSPMQQDILKIYEDGVLNSGIEIPEDIEKISKSAQPTESEILRYKLWLEQKYQSPYTGEMIPLSKLFTADYEIEHIIPQSRYFDDSFSNKVICESEVNKLKDAQLGYEFITNFGTQKVTLSGGKVVQISTKEQYEAFIKQHYVKNKAKANKLLLEDIPDKMIERQLNDTRYISKMIKNLLSNLVRSDKDDDGVSSKNVISCNGAITSILKQDWGLNDIWNELMLPRFERLNTLTGKNEFTTYNENHQKLLPTVPLELRKGFQLKRIDHRHHAMDALVIALATRNHINYLNNQTALSKIKNKPKSKEEKQKDRQDLKLLLCYKTKPDANGNYKWLFHKPWNTFTLDAKKALETIVVSFKQNLRVINKTVNYYEKFIDGKKQTVKQTKGDNWAIRKPMHKDTIYGKIDLPHIKVGKDKIITATRKTIDTTFDLKTINSITDSGIKKILRNYLASKNNDPLVAFSPEGIEDMNKNMTQYNDGIAHKPIYKVRIFEEGSRFSLGEINQKQRKYVEAAKGSNLFFAIYQDEKGKRNYETIPLNEVIEHQKWRATLPKEEQKQTPMIPLKADKGQLLFCLSPNDLVYIPTEEEKESPSLVDFKDLSKEQTKRIYKFVSCTEKEGHFVPISNASEIIKNENGTNSKNERMQNFFDKNTIFEEQGNGTKEPKPIMIKSICWKLEVNRLGEIIKIMR